LRTAALIALFLVATPPAFGAGLSDFSFEVPDLSKIWTWLVSDWSPSRDSAAEIREIDAFEKHKGYIDPIGDDGTGGEGGSAPLTQQAPTMPPAVAEDGP
jgi:hypothetical protein